MKHIVYAITIITLFLSCQSKPLQLNDSADSISVDNTEWTNSIYLTDYFVEQSIDVDSVNSIFCKNDYPFSIEERGNHGPSTSLVYDNRIKVFHTDYTSPEYVTLIRRISFEDNTQYGIMISEDVVGLDYWLFILSNDSTIYVTEKFNENTEQYEIEDVSNCPNGFITIKYLSGATQQVKCFPLKNVN